MEMHYQLPVRRKRGRYTEDFKRQVCEEYVAGGISKDELARKYEIKGHCTILKWLRLFGYEPAGHPQEKRADTTDLIMAPEKKEKDFNTEELKKQIRQLKRELANSQIKTELYSTMIEIAEQEFGIDIRKKSGSRRSVK
jgi:transposase-like protein